MDIDIDLIGDGLEDDGSGRVQVKIADSRLRADACGLQLAPSLISRNLLVNGNFSISQRGQSFTGPADGAWIADAWVWNFSGDGAVDVAITSDGPTADHSGAQTFTVTQVESAIGSGVRYYLTRNCLEGYFVAPLAYGTAQAKPVSITYWVRSSIAGTYCVSLQNADSSRSFIAEYTIHAAATWERKVLVVPGDANGTWLTTTDIGLRLGFSLAAGSAAQGTPATWLSGNYIGSASQTNLLGTLGATFELAAVQLEIGTQATPFDHRPYATELALCQRYYVEKKHSQRWRAQVANEVHASTVDLPVTMRVAPSVTFVAGTRSNVGSPAAPRVNATSCEVELISVAAGDTYALDETLQITAQW